MRTFIVLLLLLLLSGTVWGDNVDPRLRNRLVDALAEGFDYGDRWDVEVWVTDMATRLSNRVTDREERLTILKHTFIEAHQAGLDPELVLAVIDTESNFDRFAISEAGARGLMQVMPFWLKELGRPDDNLFDIATNLRFGCTILKYYLDRERGDLTRALARYNGSLGKVWYPQRVYTKLRASWYR
ncbi:lytic transglycosylase domain-containing protein [Thiohalomonas denitrificans]|uniref:Transglycosylase SLT domain-containing protein n=1 Tax=Thiohalomonas denitrificans TaxID=415747 RepID=A0A1G5QMK0_9GAMM|nr:lytic transglycosylase domain-containing protein [Thiohalomonas denitrificans]SCZ62876.1 Transglycosylase SLT domain-containing protein [Thiohalomonas denitrificans]